MTAGARAEFPDPAPGQVLPPADPERPSNLGGDPPTLQAGQLVEPDQQPVHLGEIYRSTQAVRRRSRNQPSLRLVSDRAEGSGVGGQRLGPGERRLRVPQGQVEAGANQPAPQLVAPAEGVLDGSECSGLVEELAGGPKVSSQQPA